jgi:hypothetical protein
VTGWQMVTMPTGGMIRLRYAGPDPQGVRKGAPAGLQIILMPEQMRDFAEGLLRVADRIETRTTEQQGALPSPHPPGATIGK